MKKKYIAPELKLSKGQFEVIMVNLSPKVDGDILDGEGNSHGTIGWGGYSGDGEADTKQHGWDVFGGEE